MPELPEVETIVNELNAHNLIGAQIDFVEVLWSKIIDALSEGQFVKKIAGQKIRKIYRRGKYVVIQLSHDTILVHLRMTGKIFITDKKIEPRKSEHLLIHFRDGRVLHYEDQRKFGRWSLVEDANIKLSTLGEEPLSDAFDVDFLRNLMKKTKRMIKSFLLDQHLIAGLGNIYVDEALWEARIHPETITQSISDKQVSSLHLAIRNVLKRGIENLGTSLGNHRSNYVSVSGSRGKNQSKLNVFRRNGQPCPRCGRIIAKIKVGARGTHFCPNCQKKQ